MALAAGYQDAPSVQGRDGGLRGLNRNCSMRPHIRVRGYAAAGGPRDDDSTKPDYLVSRETSLTRTGRLGRGFTAPGSLNFIPPRPSGGRHGVERVRLASRSAVPTQFSCASLTISLGVQRGRGCRRSFDAAKRSRFLHCLEQCRFGHDACKLADAAPCLFTHAASLSPHQRRSKGFAVEQVVFASGARSV